VRRESSDIDSLDKLNAEIDHLMTVIQVKFVNDGDRVEYLYRKYVQSRLFKVVEMLNEADKRKS